MSELTKEQVIDVLNDIPLLIGSELSEEGSVTLGKALRVAVEAVQSEHVIRCKDCKHRPIMPKDYENGFSLEFPDYVCPCQCDDGWYNKYPSDDWFCANGEAKMKEGEEND